MKSLDTILFDLDGTLLPLDQGAFVQAYFGLLSKLAPSLGYEPGLFLKGLWHGTMAMRQNDGGATNRQRFWEAFSQMLGPEVLGLEADLEDFYATDFNATQSALGPKADVRSLLSSLRAKGYGVTLATNPLFPFVAVISRLGWIGLAPSDFDWVTTYENSRYCKPRPGYYRDILAKLGKDPGQCMMIGNNPVDDMAAAELGMSVFLLTDYLENPGNVETGPYPRGSFAELAAFLRALPAVGAA